MSRNEAATQPKRRVLDNRAASVSDYLRERLPDADAFRLVSAYFSVYGYELLADALDSVRETRFLFGDPASLEDLDPAQKPPKSFDFTERGLAPNLTLRQKSLARPMTVIPA